MRGSETEMENKAYGMLNWMRSSALGFRRPLQKDRSRCSGINRLLCHTDGSKKLLLMVTLTMGKFPDLNSLGTGKSFQ